MRIIYFIIFWSLFPFIKNVNAQSKSDLSEGKGSISLSYLYATETSFISHKKAGVIRTLYGVGDAEENYFKTHTIHLNFSLSKKQSVGLVLKYGDNFYRSSSRRRSNLNNGDRDYESYLGFGISSHINLFNFYTQKGNPIIHINNISSLQYVRYKGVLTQKDLNSRSFSQEMVKGLFVESGLILNLRIFGSETSSFNLFYQPLNFQVGSYGLAFQYNGFGATIKI